MPSTTPTHGYFLLSQLRFHQETTMVARRTQQSTSTISRKKNRGLWTIHCFKGRAALTVAFPVAFTWLWSAVSILHAIYHTRETVFHQDNRHREENWKQNGQWSSFDEIRAIWGADETLSRVFNIPSRSKKTNKQRSKWRSKIVKIHRY